MKQLAQFGPARPKKVEKSHSWAKDTNDARSLATFLLFEGATKKRWKAAKSWLRDARKKRKLRGL